MDKKILITLIILILIAGVICGIILSNKNNNNISTNTEKQEENIITNEEIKNITNEIKENEIENDVIENTQVEPTQTQKEEPKTDKEKAIQIVKKDYKASSNVEYSVEGTDENGNQIVIVRDPETTQALAFYFVNTSNNTFTKKEMN